MRRYRALFAATVGLVLGLATTRAEGDWQTDYKKAQEQAKAGHKLLLVDFTGSDWCGWCMKLKKEVFSQREFKDYAAKNLVLVEIDFPLKKEQSVALRRQNQELAGQYDIQAFPTIILFDAEGKKVGELGYTPGGVSAFIAELEKIRNG